MQLRLPFPNVPAGDAASGRRRYQFYEFFAGGGMARAGLGPEWICRFANDIDRKKAAAYVENWGPESIHVADISMVQLDQLPGRADLAWASFPCQDLSLAGVGAGLNGRRSGTFWSFWGLLRALAAEGRAPRTVVLENVCGALTSHEGKDFAAIGCALRAAGYRFGALVVDAACFVPQSRPRLFIVGVHNELAIPHHLNAGRSQQQWHTAPLIGAHSKLPSDDSANWIWWNILAPPQRESIFSELVEEDLSGVSWHSDAETAHLIELMDSVNRRKVESAKSLGRRVVGTVYRRTRPNGNGGRVQRAEVRFDELAGCLRTPAGGSSRQTVIIIEDDAIRSRLLSPREAARLMGLPDDYKLPARYNEAYHLLGDGLVVPVVRHLARYLLEPILDDVQENKDCERTLNPLMPAAMTGPVQIIGRRDSSDARAI